MDNDPALAWQDHCWAPILRTPTAEVNFKDLDSEAFLREHSLLWGDASANAACKAPGRLTRSHEILPRLSQDISS